MTGTYLGVSRPTGYDRFQVREICAYSDYFIQGGITSGYFSVIYPGSSPLNAVKTGLNYVLQDLSYTNTASGQYNSTSG